MTAPLPPVPLGLGFQPVDQSSADHFPRRPRLWVPPVVMAAAFSAGYAIPWDFGDVGAAGIARVTAPLLGMMLCCCISGFQTYRTRAKWRLWTGMAAGVATIAVINSALFPLLLAPTLVNVLLMLSMIALIACTVFGAEPLSSIHQMPSIPAPSKSVASRI